jgi:GAF domain-containing protein
MKILNSVERSIIFLNKKTLLAGEIWILLTQYRLVEWVLEISMQLLQTSKVYSQYNLNLKARILIVS